MPTTNTPSTDNSGNPERDREKQQNRDTKSLHLKIDELLKATRGARNSMIDLDRLSDEQLARLENEFKEICGMEPVAPAGGLSAAGAGPPQRS